MDFKKLLEAMDTFAGEKVGQKPGDQVRGTEQAKPNKGKHPFLKRLVGELKQPKSAYKYEQELAEAWLEFKEAVPVPGQPAPAPGQPAPAPGATPAPAAGAVVKPTTPVKPGQPAPVDPADAAALKKNLTNLKTVLPGLDVTKATTSMAKADTGTQLSPADQAVVGKIAPQIADVMKNPQMANQFKAMIDKAGKIDAAADKVTTPTAPGAALPPGTQPK